MKPRCYLITAFTLLWILLCFCGKKSAEFKKQANPFLPNMPFLLNTKNSDSVNCFIMTYVDETCLPVENMRACDTIVRLFFTKRFSNAYILTMEKFAKSNRVNVRFKEFSEQFGNPVFLINSINREPFQYTVSKKVFRLDKILLDRNTTELFAIPNRKSNNLDGGFVKIECNIGTQYIRISIDTPIADPEKLLLKREIVKYFPEKERIINDFLNETLR